MAISFWHIDKKLAHPHSEHVNELLTEHIQHTDKNVIARILLEDEIDFEQAKLDHPSLQSQFSGVVSARVATAIENKNLPNKKRCLHTLAQYGTGSVHFLVPHLKLSTLIGFIRGLLRDLRIPEWFPINTYESYHATIKNIIRISSRPSIIGAGAYGTVFHPALPCRDMPFQINNDVSKVVSRRRIDSEKTNVLRVNDVDPDCLYHVRFKYDCVPDLNTIRGSSSRVLKLPDPHMLVYEYGGFTLTQALRSNKFPRRLFLDGLKDLLHELVQLNRRGTIHMDIKPDNIVCMVRDGKLECRLIDFGISVVLQGDKVPRPKPSYENPYIWPFKLLLFAQTLKKPSELVTAYRRKNVFLSVDYSAIVQKYIQVYKYNRGQKNISYAQYKSLVLEIFQDIDLYQFARLLQHPVLVFPRKKQISELLLQQRLIVPDDLLYFTEEN